MHRRDNREDLERTPFSYSPSRPELMLLQCRRPIDDERYGSCERSFLNIGVDEELLAVG